MRTFLSTGHSYTSRDIQIDVCLSHKIGAILHGVKAPTTTRVAPSAIMFKCRSIFHTDQLNGPRHQIIIIFYLCNFVYITEIKIRIGTKINFE